MAISASDILVCADELTKNTRGIEATCRAAIARSYYAAYHDCLAWHAKLPKPGTLPKDFSERGVHVELAEKLLNPDTSLEAEIQKASKKRGLDLRNLHADRVTADYRLKSAVSAHDARSALARARKIISSVTDGKSTVGG